MSGISSINAVQARIQQIEQQFAVRRTGAAPGASVSTVSGSALPNTVLGASATSEIGVADGAAVMSAGGTTSGSAAGIASALGLDGTAIPGLAGLAGSVETSLPSGGTFDEVFAAAVQRLRVGWNTGTVPGVSAAPTQNVGAVATPTGTAGAPTVVGGVSVAGAVNPSTPYAALFESAGARHGIPPRVLAAVGYVESRFRTDAISSAGAVGMMQFLPGTAASMGVDPYDPASAIDGAARYLRHGLDRFGSLEEAIAAYNVGPGTISRAGGVLPGTQAERYLTKVIEATGNI